MKKTKFENLDNINLPIIVPTIKLPMYQKPQRPSKINANPVKKKTEKPL